MPRGKKEVKQVETTPKRRGRPPKNGASSNAIPAENKPRKPGRPKVKQDAPATTGERRRGRPPKAKSVSVEPKQRGRNHVAASANTLKKTRNTRRKFSVMDYIGRDVEFTVGGEKGNATLIDLSTYGCVFRSTTGNEIHTALIPWNKLTEVSYKEVLTTADGATSGTKKRGRRKKSEILAAQAQEAQQAEAQESNTVSTEPDDDELDIPATASVEEDKNWTAADLED